MNNNPKHYIENIYYESSSLVSGSIHVMIFVCPTPSTPQVVAATLQAAPENLFDPTLTVVSSSSIRITWQEPGLPNGVIQEYSILLTGAGSPVYQGGPEGFQFTHTGQLPLNNFH